MFGIKMKMFVYTFIFFHAGKSFPYQNTDKPSTHVNWPDYIVQRLLANGCKNIWRDLD